MLDHLACSAIQGLYLQRDDNGRNFKRLESGIYEGRQGSEQLLDGGVHSCLSLMLFYVSLCEAKHIWY